MGICFGPMKLHVRTCPTPQIPSDSEMLQLKQPHKKKGLILPIPQRWPSTPVLLDVHLIN